MNKTFITIWNATLGAWVAVSELARARSKSSGSGAALVASVLLGAAPAYAVGPTVLPTGGQVSAGQAQITTGAGNAMTVTQASPRAAINWNTFSIGKDGAVNFVQPNASAIALNRVTGREGSVIDGALTANGQVFILNPNGVLFGQGARVDTAGLVATTLGLSDADFMSGKTRFSSLGGATGAVINQGTLNAKDGGYIALLGTQVRNDGVITARLGTVALAAGNKVSLNFNGDSLVGVVVDEGALDALVANGGAVRADGGLVVLTAKGAEGLVNTLVNNTGEVRAQTVENRAGRIYLLGENGAVEVAGSLDASAPGTGNGGFIETSAPVLKVHDGARVTTAAAAGNSGTWLIDPTDFTISAGSGAQTSSGMGSSTLQTALGAGNVTIQTQAAGTENGDINVNAPVAWSANKLTLEAHGDINVNAVMSASGSSTLDLKTGYNFNTGVPTFNTNKALNMGMDANHGFTGRIDFDRTGAGILSVNNFGYTLINSVGAAGDESAAGNVTLQGIANATNISGRYALASSIDATDTGNAANWGASNATATTSGFRPIGDIYNPFPGIIEGLGHTVNGLVQSQMGGNLASCGGLVCAADGASIQNLALTTVNFNGQHVIAPVVGSMINTTLSNLFVSGSVSGSEATIGGVFGDSNNVWPLPNTSTSFVRNVHFKGNVSGGAGTVGGIAGSAEYTDMSNVSSSGTVTGVGGNVGGLMGSFNDGTLNRASATTTVSAGSTGVGGLIGDFEGGTVSNSHFNGSVSGQDAVGGLVGLTWTGFIPTVAIIGSSASGSVSGTGSSIGGLVGVVNDGATIASSTASASVTGAESIGGLIGYAAQAAITGSTASGNVVASGAYAGGLIGKLLDTTVASSSASGDVTSTGGSGGYNSNQVGGLVGYAYNSSTTASATTFTDVFATGNVSGRNYVGGLIGQIDGTNSQVTPITGSHASGNVTLLANTSRGNRFGGLIGQSYNAVVDNSYASGTVDAGTVFGGTSQEVGGLVGYMSGSSVNGVNRSTVTNSRFIGASLTGDQYTGGLIGYANNVSITGSYVTAAINGTADTVGGLVGQLSNGSITDSHATGNVAASSYSVGGLVGDSDSPILRSYATGNVSSTYSSNDSNVGGLVGRSSGGAITDSYATGSVTSAGGQVGGLVGQFDNATMTNAYATGNVSGGYNEVGGLVGLVSGSPNDTATALISTYATGSVTSAQSNVGGLVGTVKNAAISLSYATGAVSGVSNVGGLAGRALEEDSYNSGNPQAMPNTVGRIEKSYARGSVTASNGSAGGLIGQALFMEVDQTYASGAVSGVSGSLTGVGGLIGIEGYSASGVLTSAPNTVTNSFYDTQTTGQEPAAPGTSKQTAEMNTTATFTSAGWDFTFQSGVWGRKDSVNDKYPVLRTFGYTDPLTLTLTDATKVYGDANPAFPFVSIIGCPTTNCVAAGWGSAISPTTGRGVYSYSDPNVIGLLFANGYAANQFEITFSDNSLAVSARPITLNTGATRSYNRLNTIAGSLLVAGNVVNGDAVNLGGSATLASKNVGTYSLSVAGLTLDNANYTLAGVIPSGTIAISPRTLNLGFAVADKTFDGNTAANATASDNRISGDQLTASFSAAFGDTNAGLVKAVTISGLALQGADAGNYQLASGSSTGVTGNMLARNLTYSLAAQDPTRTYTATGQVLVSAAALDQLVVASLANTIAGTSPAALSYTLWRNGQQVTDITQAGTYEIRANFATPDAHYALATTGNSTLTLTVSAATPGTPSTTLPAATLASALTNTIAQAVRTDVPSTAAVLASAGVSAARPLAEFAPMAANVASPIAGLSATFGEGAPLSLLSSPDARETSASVTLEQARRMLKVASNGNGGSADAGSREVRVPVSRNSLAEIVNGGVKLPSGVDQLLFVVKAGQ